MKKFLGILLFFYISKISFSQQTTISLNDLGVKYSTFSNTSDKNNVEIIADPRIVQLMNNFTYANSNKPIKTFRVQIYFGSGPNARNKAQTIRTEFQNKYPGTPTTLTFEEPYFKVKVGNFDNKTQAEIFRQKIKDIYKGAYVVEDN